MAQSLEPWALGRVITDIMKEGWIGEDYLILFTPEEAVLATQRYAIETGLPGYSIIGLRGWDDFILRGPDGQVYTAPTVPHVAEYLAPYDLPVDPVFQTDRRVSGKIKWHVQPIVFGGDPNQGPNLTWVSHEQHAELVVWWNNKYREISS